MSSSLPINSSYKKEPKKCVPERSRLHEILKTKNQYRCNILCWNPLFRNGKTRKKLYLRIRLVGYWKRLRKLIVWKMHIYITYITKCLQIRFHLYQRHSVLPQISLSEKMTGVNIYFVFRSWNMRKLWTNVVFLFNLWRVHKHGHQPKRHRKNLFGNSFIYNKKQNNNIYSRIWESSISR